jgi:hypothetical protein
VLFISINITPLSTATIFHSFQSIGLDFGSVFTSLTRYAFTSNLDTPLSGITAFSEMNMRRPIANKFSMQRGGSAIFLRLS